MMLPNHFVPPPAKVVSRYLDSSQKESKQDFHFPLVCKTNIINGTIYIPKNNHKTHSKEKKKKRPGKLNFE